MSNCNVYFVILFCISITALIVACLAFTKKGGGRGEYYNDGFVPECNVDKGCNVCAACCSASGAPQVFSDCDACFNAPRIKGGCGGGKSFKPYCLPDSQGACNVCAACCSPYIGATRASCEACFNASYFEGGCGSGKPINDQRCFPKKNGKPDPQGTCPNLPARRSAGDDAPSISQKCEQNCCKIFIPLDNCENCIRQYCDDPPMPNEPVPLDLQMGL